MSICPTCTGAGYFMVKQPAEPSLRTYARCDAGSRRRVCFASELPWQNPRKARAGAGFFLSGIWLTVFNYRGSE
jgi:hypothetical protein